MKQNILVKCLLAGVVGSVGALADMTVDKSNGVLTVTSDISGTVIAKVIGPNDEVVVNEKYSGSSFSWVPSGSDGAYRYDIRVVTVQTNVKRDLSSQSKNKIKVKRNYAGGSVEVKNGQIELDRNEGE